MPGVPGVTERPRSVHSGRPLRKAHTVQHRSDLLMDEQVQTVKDAQEALHKSLLEFESNKAPEHVEFHKKRVEDMKERADEAVLILKVINKLNTELAYARLIMEKTLKFGGDPNPIRKRIAWIEGKMEQLCWRKRNRPHSRTQQSPRKGIATIMTNHAEDGAENQDDTTIRRLDAGYITDYSSAHTIEPPSMSEAEDHPHLPRYRKDRVESKESERETVLTSKRKTKKKTIKDGEQIRDENNESQITQDDSSKHAKLPARPQTMPEKTDLTLYPASTAYTLDTTRQSTMLLSEPVTRESGHRGLKSEDEHKVKREQSLPEAPPPLEEPAKPDSAGSSISRATLETNNLSLPPTRETNNNNNESVFITERNNLVSRGMSRVTILSPRDTEGLQPSEYTDEERDVDIDIVEEYWNSEHHRFEYSEYADMLLQMDPLSYHQMGLAVPGTYVDAIEPKKGDLPWQAKSASELLDIHEVAMNKLSQRVHKMYDKIQDAAMMSVDPNYKKDAPIESTFLKNLDQFSSRGQTADSSHRGHSGKAPGSGSDRQTPKDDAASVTFPPLRMSAMRDKLGSTQSGRLIYYPHPLTPPAPLPITRVNKEKEYPQLPSTFNDVESPREKAERIVNQQKLYEKTKLRIYKGKVKSKTPHSQQPGYMQGVLKTSTSDFPANETSPTPSKRTTFKAMARSVSRMSAGSENMPSPRSSRRASGYSVMSNGSRASVDFTDEHDQFGWKKLKPRSGALKHSGFKWERVKDIVHNNLTSPHDEERKDAVQQLGLLKCGDTMVVYSVKECMKKDDNQEVQYEAAKTLISLGCWDEDVVQVAVRFLLVGNTEMRIDLIRAMINGRNVQYVNKSMDVFPTLVEVLSHLCENPDPTDRVAFDAAVCLGKLCVADESAKNKLRTTLFETKDTNIKLQALDILIKQLNVHDWEIVEAVLDQLRHSTAWKNRVEAAELLTFLGPRYVCVKDKTDSIFSFLESRLWDDPIKNVRLQVADTLRKLNLHQKACERALKRLDDSNEDVRTQGVISLGVLGVKSDKVIRILLEMLELDHSEYVRLMIIRTFGVLGVMDKRILRTLREREKLDGVLARESQKALKVLGVPSSALPTKVA